MQIRMRPVVLCRARHASLVRPVAVWNCVMCAPGELLYALHARRHMTRVPCAIRPATLIYLQLPQRPESYAHLFHQELRLLPRGEVSAFVELVVVDESGIGALGP